MIGFFPDPFPDEPLYSACARYGGRMDFPNRAEATTQLFRSIGSAAVDFPTGLDRVISKLPSGHLYTSEHLIDNNTHFPYVAPFLPVGRLVVLRGQMRGGDNGRIRARLGLSSKWRRPELLRFCPACVSTDREKGRETYWRRVHQLAGVDVCPDHQVFLEASSVPYVNRDRYGVLIPAEEAVTALSARRISTADRHDVLRWEIAANARWLLDWRGPYPGGESLRARYHNYFLRRGLAYYNGRIRENKLAGAFADFYPAEFLAGIGCALERSRLNWLLRLVRPHRSGSFQPPLHHILLIIFLGRSAEEFFTRYEEFEPFGGGPWPCLNRVAPHYGELTVPKCRVTDCMIKNKRGRPRGDFFRRCGFAYARTGPDSSAGDRLRFDSVISYGRVWEKAFKERWRCRTITLSEMARTFGVIPVTLKRHAIRLSLPLDRESPGSRVTRWMGERYSRPRLTLTAARYRHRAKWLSLRKAHPGAGRGRLQTLAFHTWWWLSKNDPAWLEGNSPRSRPRRRP